MAPFTSLHISADALPPHDCVEVLRENYGRTILKVDLEPLRREQPRMDVRLCAMPGLGIVTGSSSPFSAHHTVRHIDSDDLVLLVAIGGASVMKHRGREERIADGQALLTTCAEVGSNTMQTNFSCVNLCMPANLLEPLIDDLSATLMRPIPADNEALRLLVSYVGLLQDAKAFATPELRSLAVSHVHDLVALAAGATADATETARGRGVRAARLRAIKTDVVANLGSRDLSAERVAARHGLSERYFRKLFEAEGRSFSDFVLEQRLARAHRMLASPRFADRSISTIAFDVGFNDLSYFNRTFRRRYAVTPSDVRVSTRGA